MISLDDIIGMSGLTPEEVRAIGEHEHLPDVAAAALGAYLEHLPKGPETIRDMILDDIRNALKRHETAHARDLMMALRHLHQQHPDLPILRHP
jgi:hypothetical protein